MKAPAVPYPPAPPFSPLDAAEASRWTQREVYPPCQINACCAPRSSSRADEPFDTITARKRVERVCTILYNLSLTPVIIAKL